MNTSPLLVTIAPPWLLGDPRRSGNVTPLSNGLLRSDGLPSPSGIFHAISPFVRSSAVSTAYGGELSGMPRRLISSAPRANTLEYSGSTSESVPSFLATRLRPIECAARTNRNPVSGSNAAPPQLAPPPCDGLCSVPSSDG